MQQHADGRGRKYVLTVASNSNACHYKEIFQIYLKEKKEGRLDV